MLSVSQAQKVIIKTNRTGRSICWAGSGGWAEQVGGRYRTGWVVGWGPVRAAAVKRAAGVRWVFTVSELAQGDATGHGQGHWGGYQA